MYYDKLINSLATTIIGVSKAVETVLCELEGAKREKVVVVPHGFDLSIFKDVNEEDVNRVMQRHGIPINSAPIIGVVSRYIHLKGLQYVIPAFQSILLFYPDAHLVLANTKGDYAEEVRKRLRELPTNSYTEIEFEADIAALYTCFDVFVHVPIDPLSEAFGQTYVEALAAGVPSVFTLSGIAQEFIKDRNNAMVVPYKDVMSIKDAVIELLSSPQLRQRLQENGRKVVAENFELQKMIQRLTDLYED